MPHGYCFLWNPRLLWLHALSDALIATAYLTIPFALVYFARRSPNRSLRLLLYLFGLFIVSCGLTHALDVWTLWHPTYWLSGGMKALAALASTVTAAVLMKLACRSLYFHDLAGILPTETRRGSGFRTRRPFWLAYGMPLVTTAAVLLVLEAAGPGVSTNAPVILFLFPVMLSAYIGGLLPGLASTGLVLLAATYAVVPPLHSWRVADPLDAVKLIALGAAGTMMSFLMADREHSREQRAMREGGWLLASIERKVQTGFAVLLGCLVAVAAAAYPAVLRLHGDEALVAHTQQVIATLRLVLATTTDAEAGERGYIITGQEEYLAPYTSARQDVLAALRGLRGLTADNAFQQRHLDALEPLVAGRMGLLQIGIDARRQGFTVAQAVVLSGASARADTKIHKVVAEMEAHEQELLRAREARTEHATAMTKVVLGGGSALAVLIVASGLFVIGEAFKANRRDREALRRAGAYNRNLIEASIDPLVAISPQGKITDVNSATEEITGRARRHLVGADFSECFTDPEKARHGYGQVFREGSVRDYELELRHRDGHSTPVLYNASVYRGEDGQVAGVFAAARDITERKRIQQALEAERQRIFDMLESLPGMICLLDRDHRITFANRAFRDKFGEPKGLHCHEQMFGFDAPCEFCQAYSVLETGQPCRWECALPDGSVIDVYDVPFRDVDGSPMILEMSLDVTRLKRAEAARALAAIVESSEDAIVAKNLDGVIQSWNRGAERLYGYSAQEMVGASIESLLPENRRDEVDQIIGRIKNGESVDHFETDRVTKDGRLIHVSLTASPIRDAAGELAGASMIARDITRQKKAEAALQQSLERLQRVLEVETVGVMFWDLKTGCMVDANDAFLKLMGYSRREVEARELTWQKLTPPEYMDVSRAEVRKFLATGRVGPYEKEYFRKDGTKLWLLFAGSSLGGDQCVEFCVDVSERKKMEAALRESEEKFRTLANGISQLCWMARADGWIYWYNQRWYDYTGASPEQMEGWGWKSVHDPETLPKVLEQWKASIATGEPFDMVFPLRGSEGIFRPFLTRIVPVRDRDGRVTGWFGTNTDISEQRRAEEALRQRAEELQKVMDVVPAAIFLAHDPQCRRITGNPAASRLYEARRDDNVSASAPSGELVSSRRFFHDERELSPGELPMQQAAAQGVDIKDRVLDVLLPSGRRISILGHATPLRGADGRVRGCIGAFLDITEHRQAEAERARLAAIVESSDDAIIGKTLDGTITAWNHAAQRLYGYSREEVLGKPISIIIPSDRMDRVAQVDETIRRGGSVEHLETVRLRKDGTTVDVSVTVSPIKSTEGRIVGASTIARDITERKRAEQALRESEERFRTLIEQASDAVFLHDIDGRFLEVNRQACESLGYTKDELLRMGVFDVEQDGDLRAAKRGWEQAEPGNGDTLQGRHKRKDGTEFPVEVRRSAYYLGGRKFHLALARDITERKRVEQQIRELNASLERRVCERTTELVAANRELEAFTYSVAHDLRAPLRGLDGFSLALLEDYGPALDGTAHDYLSRIRSAALRMGQLIEDLLNLSRISRAELHREPVNMSDLAVAVSSEMQKASPERKGHFVIARSLEVEGDPHLLRVVLENLLGNAWKFTGKAGAARIELGTLKRDGREVYFVQDNGAGFDMQYAAKLFAPFQRLHSASDFPGTGIGLATVARIVRKHGGEIWAEAEIDKGATFYFTLGRVES